MFAESTIIFVICMYIGVLVLVAIWVENQAVKGINRGNNAIVYSLSMAIYCTSWTFYGSVGNAVSHGMLFVTMYIGPTIGILLWWIILRKLVRIKQTQRINSIADFIAARYNNSRLLAAIASLIAFLGIAPYIALQIKSIITTFLLITYPEGEHGVWMFTYVDPIFIGLMIAFTIAFGVRRLDPTDRHQGMMTAVAVESIVKLCTFLLAGIFITYFLFDGVGDIFHRFSQSGLATHQTIAPEGTSAFMLWMTYLVLAMAGVLFLPRQFHVAVVENSDEKHILTAMWLFPLYLLLINIFVLPISMAGLLKGFSVHTADTFVIGLVLAYAKPWVTLLVFLGGFSAAMSMIMISSMTMATMMTNHLLLPLFEYLPGLGYMRRRILETRWVAVALVILSGYWFDKELGGNFTLVNLGIMSFAAAVQFAPPIIGGLFWRRGNHYGTLFGMSAGFILWIYTLLVPALAKSGLISGVLLVNGPWGISMLRPEHLLGITVMDPLTHSVFWSLLFNIGLYVACSLLFERSMDESRVISDFIDVLNPETVRRPLVNKEPSISVADKLPAIKRLLAQYLSQTRSTDLITESLKEQNIDEASLISVLEMAEFCNRVEKKLAGSIGTAEAHQAFKKISVFTEQDAAELTSAYGEILASLDLSPDELYQKINYYQDRDKLVSEHAKELEEKIKALQAEIDERMRVETALKISEDKYRVLIENATDAIAIIQGRKIVFTNPAALRLLQYSESELRNMDFTDLLHPDDRMTGSDRYQRRLSGELTKGYFEYRFIAKDESIITGLVSSVKIVWEGQPALMFIARDITEQKKLEARLLQSHKMEALGTLAGGVAHDFNNLLMGLQGNVSLMLLSLGSQQPDYGRLKNMEQYISDATRLTSQLLGMARKGKYEVRTTNINDLVAKTSSMFGRAKKELKVMADLKKVHCVEVDRGQIEQVLLNLFVNAWQAMPGGGKLYLSTENVDLGEMDVQPYGLSPGVYVKLSVTDTGIGIDPDIQKKVFDPFFTTKNMGRGTGLGLSSAYGIIKNHNGFISIDSEPNKGTTFNVFLPASSKDISFESEPVAGMHYGAGTILIVDDEEMIREVGTEILNMLGYRVLTADTGEKAEEIFKENKDKIEMVILDLILPETSGSMIYDLLKKHDPEVKVLLSSGYSLNEQATEIIEKGANGFIQKPFNSESLSLKVRDIIEGKSDLNSNGVDCK